MNYITPIPKYLLITTPYPYPLVNTTPYSLEKNSVFIEANDDIVSIKLADKEKPSKKERVWAVKCKNKEKADKTKDYIKKEFDLFLTDKKWQHFVPLDGYRLLKNKPIIDKIGLSSMIPLD